MVASRPCDPEVMGLVPAAKKVHYFSVVLACHEPESIDTIKPLPTVLSSAVNKSRQCRESNPEQQSESAIHCAMRPPRITICLWPLSEKEELNQDKFKQHFSI